MNPALPYDIWVQISQYLSVVQLRDLYGLNQAFYDVAMNERYREVNFHHLTDGQTLRNLFRMRYSPVAERVQKFCLHPTLISKLMEDEKPRNRPQAWPKMFKLSLKGLKPSPPRASESHLPFPQDAALESITDIIRRMTNVTSYSIEFWNQEDLGRLRIALPVLEAAWSTFSETLTDLSLDVPLEGLSEFLNGSLTFHSLRAFSIRLTRTPESTLSAATNIIRRNVIPFMNNHVYTLERLAFTTLEDFDFSVLLPDFHHFPYLVKVHISHPFVSLHQTNTHGLRYFLAIHSGCIRDLNLQFHLPPNTYPKIPSPTSWYSQDFFRVYLTCLETLELSLRGIPGDATCVLGYLSTLSLTLTSLTLRDHSFTLYELKPLAKLFQATGMLRNLTLDVECITPQHFDLFASNLPSLQTLKLMCGGFAGDGSSQDRPSDLSIPQSQVFCSIMRKRDYTFWKLRHLTIYTTDQLSNSTTECKSAIVDAFPSLQTVDGKPVSELACTPVSSASSLRPKIKSVLLSKRPSFASFSSPVT